MRLSRKCILLLQKRHRQTVPEAPHVMWLAKAARPQRKKLASAFRVKHSYQNDPDLSIVNANLLIPNM
jgi:hypothetical protein